MDVNCCPREANLSASARLMEVHLLLRFILGSFFVTFQNFKSNLLDSWMNTWLPVSLSPLRWGSAVCVASSHRCSALPAKPSTGKGLQIHPSVGLRLSRALTVKSRQREKRGRQQQPGGRGEEEEAEEVVMLFFLF